jgi:hypothetical protein
MIEFSIEDIVIRSHSMVRERYCHLYYKSLDKVVVPYAPFDQKTFHFLIKNFNSIPISLIEMNEYDAAELRDCYLHNPWDVEVLDWGGYQP